MLHCRLLDYSSFRLDIRSILLLVSGLCFALIIQAGNPLVCSAQGNCPEPAAYGRQPFPNELVKSFDRAGTNRLGTEGPNLPQIWKGYPPSQAKKISPYVPCILLKAIGYTESTGWKQFDAAYGQEGWTVISQDCGYGIMQITSGMGVEKVLIPVEWLLNLLTILAQVHAS